MNMQFMKNLELKTIKPDYEGNKVFKGKFLNYRKVKNPSFLDILKWSFSRSEVKRQKQNNPWEAPVVPLKAIEVIDLKCNAIIWLGHASFLIIINGKVILTDPVFGDIPFVKRLTGMPCEISDLIKIDYILLSHSHFDHIDKNSLQQVCLQNPHAIIYCGLNHKNLFKKFNIKNLVIEAGWYQQFPDNLDGLEFYFMPALHWSSRGLFDRNIRLWGSFVIKSKDSMIYFMGDSGYDSHFKEIGDLFGKFDYCLMGVGAFLPWYIMHSSHTTPYEAVNGFHDLGGRTFIPMHYGTYDLADEPLEEPLHRLRDLDNNNLINGKLLILKIGEVTSI